MINVIVAVALFWSVINGVLFRAALRVAEASFQEYDELIEPETELPTVESPGGISPPGAPR